MTATRLVFGTYDLPDSRWSRGCSTASSPVAGGRWTWRTCTATASRRAPGAGGCSARARTWSSTPRAAIRHTAALRSSPPRSTAALALLGVERIDVFLLHRDDPSRPAAEWADALRAGARRDDRRVRRLELDRRAPARAAPRARAGARVQQPLLARGDGLAAVAGLPGGVTARSWARSPTSTCGDRVVEPRDGVLRRPRRRVLGQPAQPGPPRAGGHLAADLGTTPPRSRSPTCSSSRRSCCPRSARVRRSTSTMRSRRPSSSSRPTSSPGSSMACGSRA